MADYSLPLVDTLAQLQEPRVAVTAAHLFGSGCSKEANGCDRGIKVMRYSVAEMQILTITNLYNIMAEMWFSSVSEGPLLERPFAVSEKSDSFRCMTFELESVC